MDYTGYNQYGARPYEPNGVDRFVTNMAGTTSGTVASGMYTTNPNEPENEESHGLTTTFTVGPAGGTLQIRIYRYSAFDVPITMSGDYTSGPDNFTAGVDQTVDYTWVLPANGRLIFNHGISKGIVFNKDNFFLNGSKPNLVNSVPPSGVVDTVNLSDNSVFLLQSQGDWSANTGNWAVGPTKTLDGTAPDPSGINFRRFDLRLIRWQP